MFTPFIHFKMLSMFFLPGSIIFYHFPITLSPSASIIFDVFFDLFRHRSLTEEQNEDIYARSNLSKSTQELFQKTGNKSFPFSHIYKMQSKCKKSFKSIRKENKREHFYCSSG